MSLIKESILSLHGLSLYQCKLLASLRNALGLVALLVLQANSTLQAVPRKIDPLHLIGGPIFERYVVGSIGTMSVADFVTLRLD